MNHAHANRAPLWANVLMKLLIICFCAFCLIPVLMILSVSFSDEQDIVKYGYQLIPRAPTLNAYQFILRDTSVFVDAYIVTISVTIAGTLCCLLLTSMLAYALSRKEVRYRNQLSFYVYFTLLFGGGLVPYYILITRTLHLNNTPYVLVVTMLVSPVHVLIMKNFFKALPDEIVESARIDGSGEFRTFLQIIVPLSTPSLATIGLFAALAYWNDWFTCAMYIDNPKLYMLQYLLQSLMNTITVLMQNINASRQMDIALQSLPNETARMAMCMLSIGPIILLYPFLQRFFVKGLTLGAVKS